MAPALATGQRAITRRGRADDRKLVCAVIEAGLFGTQPVHLAAHVVRAGAKWIVTGLKGTIGGSDLTGHVTVDKRRGRTRLDGAVAFGTLDFEDLASDAGHGGATSTERPEGLRPGPDTRLHTGPVGPTDGGIAVEDRAQIRRRPHMATSLTPHPT